MKAAITLAKWTFERFGKDSRTKPNPFRQGSDRWNAYENELDRLMEIV